MSVEFIVGRSGTGKTKYCINSIIKELGDSKENRPLVLLVPEQATYQAERTILSHPQIAGFHSPTAFADVQEKFNRGLNILSFDRLLYLLLGKTTAKTRVSFIGRQMIIHRILIENKDKLQLFASASVSPGLSQKIAEAVIELHKFAIEPEEVEGLIEKLKGKEDTALSAMKLEDLSIVLQQYMGFMENSFIDPDTQLAFARSAIGGCRFLKDAKLWVDGFSGFSGWELSLLSEILKTAGQSHIALCLDPEKIDLNNPANKTSSFGSLFYPTEKTYGELLGIIRNNKIGLSKPVILKTAARNSQSPSLKHLEQNLFEASTPKIEASENIQIVTLPNARGEAMFAAREISKLVRQKGLRFRDIAVIASDLSIYEHYIRAIFTDYKIPFFIDRRKTLRHHPVVCLLTLALRTAVNGFSTPDIIACLKTGFMEIADYDIDTLENYCIAFAVDGSDWTIKDDWNFDDKVQPSFYEAKINKIRRKAIEPFLKLRSGLCGSEGKTRVIRPEQFTVIVFDFLESCHISKQLNNLVELKESQKDYAAAEENRQVYNSIVDVLDELCEAFAGTELSSNEFSDIIQDALYRITLAFVPPSLDEVTVGSIERSRHPDLKAVFLIGTTQKQFPAPLNYERIITDADLQACTAAGVELEGTSEQTLAGRRYLSYIAFTRPSQFLYITYPSADDKGRGVCRSQFVDDIEILFDNLKEKKVFSGQEDLLVILSQPDKSADESLSKTSGIVTREELTDALCCSNAGGKLLEGFLDCLRSDSELAEIADFAAKSFSYSNTAELDKEVVGKLFGDRLNSSATRLQTFACCPYKYFAQYVLALKERPEFKLKPIDLGVFYHSCLETFFSFIIQRKTDIKTIGKEEIKQVLEQSVFDVISKSSYFSSFCRRGSHNQAIVSAACQNLGDFLNANFETISAGTFRPAFTEITFGRKDAALGSLTLKLKNGQTLYLSGKIDRIDLTDTNNIKLTVIFDYKTKGQSFNWQQFYYGLDIQLPLYMLAVGNSHEDVIKGVEVCGGFYLPIEVAPGQGSFFRTEKEIFNYKAKGIFNGKYYKMLDGNIEQGWSRYYKFYVGKEKQQYGNYDTSSDILTAEDFEMALKLAAKEIKGLAEQILNGVISVWPYQLNSGEACNFCAFKSLCRFDWQINDHHLLAAVSKKEVLERAKQTNER
jgi:ATP-dependent helicase/nuclease subunit B